MFFCHIFDNMSPIFLFYKVHDISMEMHYMDNKVYYCVRRQDLCPALISSLGRPSVDRGVSVQKPVNQNDVGRGSGCTTTATVSTPAARTIYSIAVELARLVGNVPSLRPVLESLYYRMLIYPPPVHRLEALKAIRIVRHCLL